jgi:hypothetical protein
MIVKEYPLLRKSFSGFGLRQILGHTHSLMIEIESSLEFSYDVRAAVRAYAQDETSILEHPRTKLVPSLD